MRILITGATGFVGQNLIPMLAKRFPKADVMTLNRNIAKAKTLFSYGHCNHVEATDWKSVRAFEPDIVLHLAAMSTSSNDTIVIQPLIESNILYGVQLLDALKDCKSLRLFVNTGSFAEYRFGPASINDAYLYTATKSAFRSFVNYYSQLGGYKYVTIVPYTIYGGKKTVKRLVDYIWESIDSKDPVSMTAGEQILDFTHVDDLCDFYLTLIEKLDTVCSLNNGEEFHVGTGIGNTPKDVAHILEELTHKKCNIQWGGRPYRERDTMHAVAPIAKNLDLLDWRAKISLREGLNKMLDI